MHVRYSFQLCVLLHNFGMNIIIIIIIITWLLMGGPVRFIHREMPTGPDYFCTVTVLNHTFAVDKHLMFAGTGSSHSLLF